MRDDALPIGRLLLIGAAIFAVVAITVGVAFAVLAHRRVPPGGLAIDKPARLGADLPMLQSAPQPDLASYQAAKLQALHGLGWVDAASGVAHVPIEAAMALRAAGTSSAGAPR
jgi:hypothetical protein